MQAVLTEVLTNRQLREQLHQADQPAPPPEEPRGQQSLSERLWQATTAGLRRTVQAVRRAGRSARMTLLTAGGVMAGVLYAARQRLASLATAVYHHGKGFVRRAISALTSFLPSFACSG